MCGVYILLTPIMRSIDKQQHRKQQSQCATVRSTSVSQVGNVLEMNCFADRVKLRQIRELFYKYNHSAC